MIYAKYQNGYTKISKLSSVYTTKDTVTIVGDVTYCGPLEYDKPSNWKEEMTQVVIMQLESLISSDYSKMKFLDPQKLINTMAEHDTKDNNDIKVEDSIKIVKV